MRLAEGDCDDDWRDNESEIKNSTPFYGSGATRFLYSILSAPDFEY